MNKLQFIRFASVKILLFVRVYVCWLVVVVVGSCCQSRVARARAITSGSLILLLLPHSIWSRHTFYHRKLHRIFILWFSNNSHYSHQFHLFHFPSFALHYHYYVWVRAAIVLYYALFGLGGSGYQYASYQKLAWNIMFCVVVAWW